MKERILTGWSFQRALFLLVGGFIMVQSAVEGQWFGIAFGSYFAAMGLFRFGCAAGGCYGDNCQTTSTQNDQNELQDVEFEEVKKK